MKHHQPTKLRKTLTRRAAALAAGLALAGGLLPAAQAEGQLRIAQQFGIVYLMLDVAKSQRFIEKAGEKLGQEVKVDWVQLSGGPAINDALLSGAIDIGGAGVGPLLTLWDRTRGRQDIKGVASLGNFPYYLVSINPKVRTIDDLGDADRIAVPAVGVSVQSRILQLASARRWGDDAYKRLDRLQVAVPHPDATAALIKGGTEITAHFGNPPFQEQSLAGNPAAHVVLNSYEVLGGPSSATVLYATSKFRSENPKTYRAFIEGLGEAARFIAAKPEQAADIFIESNKSKIDRELVLRIIKSPEVRFTLQPQNTLTLASFMHRVGAIKHKPASSADYFFDDAHSVEGN